MTLEERIRRIETRLGIAQDADSAPVNTAAFDAAVRAFFAGDRGKALDQYKRAGYSVPDVHAERPEGNPTAGRHNRAGRG